MADDREAEFDRTRTSGSDRAVGGVLLAAGRSRRFEAGNKLLATAGGEPIVRRAARALADADLDGVVAIVGHEASAVADALAGLDADCYRNERYAAGQSTSVRAGVEAARERDWDAAVFALGDMPFVGSAAVDRLRSAYAAGEGTILAAAYEGHRGNPVLFDSAHFQALADVTGDRGGRRLIEKREGAALVETGDPGVVRDVDTEADLRRYGESG